MIKMMSVISGLISFLFYQEIIRENLGARIRYLWYHSRKKGIVMNFNKIRYDVISSTNDEAKKRIEEGNKEPVLILARKQLCGRGRGLHSWESSHIGNIYSSYAFKVGENVRDLPQLSLIASLAVVRAVEELFKRYDITGKGLCIKWPNDVLLNHKKIAGILTEMIQDKNEYYAVIGIGINVDSKAEEMLKKNLPYAGSIAELVSENIGLDEVQELVEQSLSSLVDEFLSGSRFDRYYKEYNAYLINHNKTLLYETDGKVRTGFCLGIDCKGYLLIKNYKNEVDKIGFGEVNIKGVYGY